jgi:cbb3-type cytochrome oxidase maturation protein
MSVLYVALPVAILMGAAALVACVISIRGGQFDDLESPPLRMLIDDRHTPAPPAVEEGRSAGEPAKRDNDQHAAITAGSATRRSDATR